MSAATIERPKAQRSTAQITPPPTPPATVWLHDQPAEFNYLDADRRLRRAQGMSTMLSMLFANATAVAPIEITQLQGLMGALQHLRHTLTTLQVDVMEVDREMPDDFREAIDEAHGFATLADEVEWADAYELSLPYEVYAAVFDGISARIAEARKAIEAERQR